MFDEELDLPDFESEEAYEKWEREKNEHLEDTQTAKPVFIRMGVDIDWVLSMDSETFNKFIKGNNGETEQELRAYFQKLKDAGKTSIFDTL